MPEEIFTDVKLEQESNALGGIEPMESGRLIDVSDVQPAKTSSPREVTLLGIVIEFKEVHSLKAFSPIDFTPLGMLTEDRAEQEVKASAPIDTRLEGR
jgi:hypothetical protein